MCYLQHQKLFKYVAAYTKYKTIHKTGTKLNRQPQVMLQRVETKLYWKFSTDSETFVNVDRRVAAIDVQEEPLHCTTAESIRQKFMRIYMHAWTAHQRLM